MPATPNDGRGSERERDEALHHAKLSESHYQSLARDVDAGMLHDRDWERERRTLQAKVRELEAAAEELESDHEQRCEWLQKAEYVRDAARESNVANFNKAIELSRELASMRDERDAARANYIDLEQQLQVVQRDHGIALVDLKAMEEMRDAARAKAEAFQKEVENCKASSAVFNPQQSPDGLSAILEELRDENIYTDATISVKMTQPGGAVEMFEEETVDEAVARIESLACLRFPNSSFARRRAEATVEPTKPPVTTDDIAKHHNYRVAKKAFEDGRPLKGGDAGQVVRLMFEYFDSLRAQPPQPAEPPPLSPESMASVQRGLDQARRREFAENPPDVFADAEPTPADPARELLDAGEWSVKSEPYSSAYCVMAGNEFFCHCTNDDLDQFVALCAIVNRYRAIEAAVNGRSFVRETIMSNLGGSTWESLHAALRPLLRTSAKEA